MAHHNTDYHNSTVTIRGKQTQKSTTINMDNIQRKPKQSGMNAAAFERKIDDGTFSGFEKINPETKQQIIDARVAKLVDGSPMKQAQLASSINGISVTSNDIRDMENGTMIVTSENNKKINAVKKFLGIKPPVVKKAT